MSTTTDIVLHWPDGVPLSEMNREFLQAMINRMATSFFKYGYMRDAAAAGVDQPESLRVRLERYEDTGNTEWLVDVANMAMIEFSHPQHPEAHFRATDSSESPGRAMPAKVNVMGATVRQGLSQAHNLEVG